MALKGISAYQQTNRTIQTKNTGPDRMRATDSSKTDLTDSAKENRVPDAEMKGWSPIDKKSSLIPGKTEYGNTIGDVKLSEKAADYLDKLKSKFHNMEFITVSKGMKTKVQQNAAAYGNAKKMVVLIDEEKLERMATDESYRKKYEGIIAMSQKKLDAAKASLASTGAGIKNFGMSIDSNGNENFFATVEKSQDLQKKRMEKKAAEKKEQKSLEKKATKKKNAEKKAAEKKEQRAEEKKIAEKKALEAREQKKAENKTQEESLHEAGDDKPEYAIFEEDSMEKLLSKVRDYSYALSVSKVLTDTERALGTQVDYKG